MKKRIVVVKKAVDKKSMSDAFCCIGAVIRILPGF